MISSSRKKSKVQGKVIEISYISWIYFRKFILPRILSIGSAYDSRVVGYDILPRILSIGSANDSRVVNLTLAKILPNLATLLERAITN